MKRIDVLYFDGCPNHLPAVEMARSVADKLGIEAEIHQVEVFGPEDAQRLRFLGSPSIRVDGVDVEPSARARSDFGYSCRTYSGNGVPTAETLSAALTGGGTPAGGSSRGSISFGLLASTGSVFAAAVASACCWLPLLLLALGFSAGSLAAVFETTRPYFLGTAALLLTAGFYLVYFRNERCEPGSSCETQRKVSTPFVRSMLWVSTVIVIAFASIPFYVGVFQPETIEAAAGTTADSSFAIEMEIDGMTCPGCAVIVDTALMKIPGVLNVDVDHASASATLSVAADAGVSEEHLVDAVTTSGFSGRIFTPKLKTKDATGARTSDERPRIVNEETDDEH